MTSTNSPTPDFASADKSPGGGPVIINGKGLRAGTLGLTSNVVMGLSSVAPAYSLAATLGLVVAAVHTKAPAMFVLAFVPMLLIAFAYRELGEDTPDCGTTFTWATKAFGPWVGWMGGWGVAVSAIIVLANVAEIAGVYMLRFLDLGSLADDVGVKIALGSVLIVVMTFVSVRGIVLGERLQNVLMLVQFGVMIVASIIALIQVWTRTAGPQSVTPSWDWLLPTGLSSSQIAAGIILCIFIYWGWDTCLAVGEETKNSAKTPGRAAVLTTLILVLTYVLVAYAVQSFAGFGTSGIGLNNPDNSNDAFTILGEPVGGVVLSSALLLTVAISALASTQSTILPTARGTLSMAVYEAIPRRFAVVDPKFMTPKFGTLVMGASALVFYLTLALVSQNTLQDSVSSLGLAVAFYYGITAYSCVWYFRRTLFRSWRHLTMRGILPLLGALAMTWAFVKSATDMYAVGYGTTAFGGVGGVFVIGIGMLVLGVPLMLLCIAGGRSFFRGETLTASTEVKVPDVY